MIAYKLVRKMKDGTLAPLFINKRQRFPLEQWMQAESHPTKGFALRPGFHCTSNPYAPHLSPHGRVWCKVAIRFFEEHQRPESQGGLWYTAQWMKVIEELDSDTVAGLLVPPNQLVECSSITGDAS